MGNLLLSNGLFKTDGASLQHVNSTEKFTARRISDSIIYYYVPITSDESHNQDSHTPEPSLCLLFSKSPSDHPKSGPSARPLVLFFSWLGAQPGAVAKYRDFYLDRGMDVLLVRSRVTHFLWPRWGLRYGLQVLKVLGEAPFADRDVLVHASSIGGFTFTQVLAHIALDPKRYGGMARKVKGQIYDSLVVGSLEHMATGLGMTLLPCLECFVKNTALLYFWLFKSHTADHYESSVQLFYKSPVTSPALFFFSENDAMCSPAVMEKLMGLWRHRGVSVDSRRWKESTHAAHLRSHPEEYKFTLQRFLDSLRLSETAQ